MSTYISSEADLTRYANEVSKGTKPSISMGTLSIAVEGLKSGIGISRNDTSQSDESVVHGPTTSDHAHDQANDGSTKLDRDRVWQHFGTSIDDVPFAVLGATPRDTRTRIVELAEERSLELDPVLCQKARSDLTNPRTRLSAELAWFPGLSPGKIVKCLGELHSDPMSIRDGAGLPPLAHFNLMTYALEAVNDGDGDDLAAFVCEVADLAEDVDSDSVLRDINEDRDIAKFPPVQATEQVEAALSEHNDRCRDGLKRALNRLPSATLVHVLTAAVDTATDSGETPAPKLLDDLVDSYAVEIQATLDTGAVRIRKLVAAVKSSVGNGAAAVDAKIAQLEVATKKWDAIAQPIQLSAKARGINHELSNGLASEIRSLAVDLFNSHDLLAQAQHITKLLQEVFAELPEVAERVDKDADDLEEIAQSRSDANAFQPLRARCQQASEKADKYPQAAYQEGELLLRDGLALLKAVPVDAGSPSYRNAKDILAGTLMHCAIEYGNKTSNWAPCVALLERALELATDTKLRQRISENLATAKSNHDNLGGCDPVGKAPSLHTVNGIGFTLYGNTDPKPDGSHMATYYFVFFAIPVFPIARYRVLPISGGYRFLGKAKLRTFDKWHLGISLALICWMILAAMA
ncbi:MAG: hypothetical protein ACRD22_10865 [Terriglobia bacterium]